MIEFEGKIIDEVETNEYGEVQLPPKIEWHIPLKKEEFYKYAKTHLSSAYGKMVTSQLANYSIT